MNFKYAKGMRAKLNVLFGRPSDLDPRYGLLLERKLLNVVPGQRQPTIAIRQYVTYPNHIFPLPAICRDSF